MNDPRLVLALASVLANTTTGADWGAKSLPPVFGAPKPSKTDALHNCIARARVQSVKRAKAGRYVW